MSREALTRILVLVLVGLAGWWLLTATEWVEVEVDTPPKGQAARNPLFAAELVLQRLGVRVERRQGLDAMPPPGARLLLDSRHWDLFPERAQRLRRWVEGGGHLVLNASMLNSEDLKDWVPVELAQKEPRAPASSPQRPRPGERLCRTLASAPEPSASYRICLPPYGRQLRPAPGATTQWQLQGADGAEVLRVQVGRGSVTVTGPWTLMHNREVLREDADHALVMTAALQAQRGAGVWIVAEEAREPLLRWLWQYGWIAVLLALAAAAAGLWRSAVRFGPVGIVAPPERRSMKEQVAGTGAFLRHHGPAALHAAQVRAVQEAARRRLPGYSRLGRPAAAAAIARATGLRAADLERALQPVPRGAHFLASDLELLELARRRLAAPATGSPSTPSP
jgi:hypothetical protein